MKRVLCSLLMIGAVGRVARAGVQRAHRRWGIEGSNRLPPAARPLRTWLPRSGSIGAEWRQGWRGSALAPSGNPVTQRWYHCRGQPGWAHL